MNSSSVVFDSSVVLALIRKEPGSQKITPDLLVQSAISTVNLAEVQGRLVGAGWSREDAWLDATSTGSAIMPFTTEQAEIAGNLIAQTRSLGLSLGDRACLALALEQNAPVYTADRAWKNLKLAIPVHVIR